MASEHKTRQYECTQFSSGVMSKPVDISNLECEAYLFAICAQVVNFERQDPEACFLLSHGLKISITTKNGDNHVVRGRLAASLKIFT